MKRILATLLLAGSAICAQAAPTTIQTTWNIYKGSLKVATISERFMQTGGHYRIDSETRPAGILALVTHETISATSSGFFHNGQLQPEHFEQRRSQDTAKSVSADFDWRHGVLKMHHDGHTDTAPLPRGTQDSLSLLYQVMFDAPVHGRLNLHMTTGKKLELGLFQIGASQTLDTPMGELPTQHLVRLHARDEKGMEIWLAPGRQYLPVQMVLRDKDDSLSQKIVSATITN